MSINVDFTSSIKTDLENLQTTADSLKSSVSTTLDTSEVDNQKTTVENNISNIQSEIDDIDSQIESLDPEDPYYEIDLSILTEDKNRYSTELTELQTISNSLNDISNTINDAQSVLNQFSDSSLDVLSDVSSGLNDIAGEISDKVNLLDGKCNLPLPLSEIGIEDIKLLAEKFAAKKLFDVALQTAKQGVPSSIAGQVSSAISKFDSIKSTIDGKIGELKGVASKAQSLKDDFSSLVNGDLSPESILAIGQKWGGNVPGLGGLLDTASQGLNSLQNFDICSLVPNFKLNPETGEVTEEPNDPVPPTEEPEPAKVLVPTVEDSREKETQTIDEKYGGAVQVDEKRQVELEKQRELYDKDFAEATQDVTDRFKGVDKALKDNIASEGYKSLIQKSEALQQPLWRVVEIAQLSPEEESAYLENRELSMEWGALSELLSKLKQFEFIYRNRLTNRSKNNSGKAVAIENANQAILNNINDADNFSSITDYTPKVNYSYVSEQAEKCFNVLKKHSSQLYDYYNYYDHNL